MSSKKSPPVVQRNLALVLCSDQAGLEETLLDLELKEIPHERLGARPLLVLASEVEPMRAKLNEHGIFPRIVGDIATPVVPVVEAEEVKP